MSKGNLRRYAGVGSVVAVMMAASFVAGQATSPKAATGGAKATNATPVLAWNGYQGDCTLLTGFDARSLNPGGKSADADITLVENCTKYIYPEIIVSTSKPDGSQRASANSANTGHVNLTFEDPNVPCAGADIPYAISFAAANNGVGQPLPSPPMPQGPLVLSGVAHITGVCDGL